MYPCVSELSSVGVRTQDVVGAPASRPFHPPSPPTLPGPGLLPPPEPVPAEQGGEAPTGRRAAAPSRNGITVRYYLGDRIVSMRCRRHDPVEDTKTQRRRVLVWPEVTTLRSHRECPPFPENTTWRNEISTRDKELSMQSGPASRAVQEQPGSRAYPDGCACMRVFGFQCWNGRGRGV